MADLRFAYRTQPFASFTTVDIVAAGIAKLRISKGVDHPATAEWVMYDGQHELPIPIGACVKIWDADGTDPDDDAYSADNPLFLGHVAVASPGEDANLIVYQAFDPTYRSDQTCNVMSTAWEAGDVATLTWPQPAATAYPRLIMNATLQSDDDWVYSRGEGLTTAIMIQDILDDQYHPLYWCEAAPGDGSDAGNGSAYVTADFASMTYVPQEKFVAESENVRSAVLRVLQDYPSHRLLFHPGTQKWRFFNLKTAPQVDLTLNDFSGDNMVLSLSLQRSMEGRYTAVKIYGPEVHQPAVASSADGSLTVIAESKVTLELLGSVEVNSYTRFQVTDATKRRIASFLPEEIYVNVGGYFWLPCRSPSFQISYDGGVTWGGALGVYYDFFRGIVYLSLPQFYHTSEGRVVSTGVQHFFPPTDYRLVYAYLDTPIFTRYPSTGYEGTAYTVGNLKNELHRYDEALSVGKNWFGVNVTTTERLAEFYKLAEQLHSYHKDIIYTGGCVLQGIRYEFANLNRRVNFPAVDGDGDELETGWEDINCFLTDVEYDYENDVTTLQFSSDHLALIGQDPEEIKKRLKIRALRLQRFWRVSVLSTGTFRGWSDVIGSYIDSRLYGVATYRDAWVDQKTGAESNT